LLVLEIVQTPRETPLDEPPFDFALFTHVTRDSVTSLGNGQHSLR